MRKALRKRRTQSNRPLLIGFLVTVLVLSGTVVVLIYTRPSIQQVSLPSAVPEYDLLWGRYVPATVSLFGFENYTYIREYNSSYPTQYSTLLAFPDLNLTLKSTSIDSALTLSFDYPNESVAFAFVNQGAFQNFTKALATQSSSATYVGNSSMYYVRDYVQGNFVYGWLSLTPADRAVGFASGGQDAKTALNLCLRVQGGTVQSLISEPNVRRMLYIANGTANHLAIGVQAFPGVLSAANSTMTVVDPSNYQVQIRRLLEFKSTSVALDQLSNVKTSYLNSHHFVDFEQFIQATEYQSLAKVSTAVRLVE